ncbi:MAG: tol-pal system protein YbgF [Alphaproteobacteria bacterium]|nr:tol-pal system protein YbgF [Alphaproteobacteria bacterium]
MVVAALSGDVFSIRAAHAQSNKDVANRISHLEAEIRDLQRHLFAGKSQPAPLVSSTSIQETAFTPKDGASASVAVRTELRLRQLEAQIRNLTGKVEELGFKITQFDGRIDALVSDLDRRFAAIEGGGGAETSVSGVVATVPSTSNAPTTNNDATAGGLYASAGGVGAKKRRVLGYLNESDLRRIAAGRSEEQNKASPESSGKGSMATEAIGPPPASVASASTETAPKLILPEGDSATRYKYAFSFLMRHDYEIAEKAFREFVDGNGDDPLAGNAMYWLGETYYVREMFAESAVTFAEGYEKYPGSPKTADNLLKLGFSLARLRRIEDACVALAQLSDEFPNASATIKRRALNEGKRIECKG